MNPWVAAVYGTAPHVKMSSVSDDLRRAVALRDIWSAAGSLATMQKLSSQDIPAALALAVAVVGGLSLAKEQLTKLSEVMTAWDDAEQEGVQLMHLAVEAECDLINRGG